MSLEMVADEYGTTMELFRFSNGKLGATDFIIETVENLPKLPLRDDDVMLCSYAKSGCHWIWEVLRHLILGDDDSSGKVDKEAYMVELNTFEDLGGLASPRILNNHCYFEDQPRDLLKKKVKVVFVYRNVKDLAVSYYYHHTRFHHYKYQDTFSHYLRRFAAGAVDNGSVFEYLRSWEDGILNNPGLSVHILSYEDMKENPVRELRRLSEYLGKTVDDDFLLQVAAATDFEVMQKRKATVTQYLDHEGKPVMYRKGQVGDWKNHFLVADSEWMDDLTQRELGQSKLFKFRHVL